MDHLPLARCLGIGFTVILALLIPLFSLIASTAVALATSLIAIGFALLRFLLKFLKNKSSP